MVKNMKISKFGKSAMTMKTESFRNEGLRKCSRAEDEGDKNEATSYYS
jgi:hypothetical protein